MTDVDETGPADDATEAKTVLFADIVDSTRLFDERGDAVARGLLVRCLDLMASVVGDCKGRVEDRIGDELLITFDDPDAAAHAAGQLHQRIQDGHAKGELDCPMRIRIGLEHGPIMRTTEGLFGTTIHTAARLVALAKAGQILTTKTTLDRFGPLRRRMERYYDTIVLKGIACEQDIHELLWDTSVTMVPTGRPRRRREAGTAAVEICYGDKTIRVDAGEPRITLGRDSTCTLQLEGNAVSRFHARVVWNRGKARLEDMSTNGTCVEPADGSAVTLHRDGAELKGHGVLRCGCLGREEDAALIEYRCVSEEA